jgi:hypothetical protein
MRCQHCQDMMVEALYGELDADAKKRFDDHVVDCEACASQLSEMQGTLDVMSKHERRDPGQAYWDGYWNRLSARMEEEQVARGSARVAWWRWSVLGGASSRISWAYRAAAAAAILTIGIFAGRTFFTPGVVTPEDYLASEPPAVETQIAEEDRDTNRGAIDSPPGEQQEKRRPASRREEVVPQPATDVHAASADERAMCYIEKSQLLLVALVNNDPSAPDAFAGGFGERQRRSTQLVAEAAEIKDELDDPKQRRLRALVAELEKILVQISNLESEEDVESVEFIRSRVNDHDVLLKINLEQMRHGVDDDGCASGEAVGPTRKGASGDV